MIKKGSIVYAPLHKKWGIVTGWDNFHYAIRVYLLSVDPMEEITVITHYIYVVPKEDVMEL